MLRVLVVDDDFVVREGMRVMINWPAMGCELVGLAEDGVEALNMVAKLRPDVVLADVVMPRMGGLELLEKLREQYPQVAVVILSAFDEAEYVRRSLRFQATDYLLKPLKEEEIRATMQRIRVIRDGQPIYHTSDHLPDDAYNEIRALSEAALESLRTAEPEQVEKKTEEIFFGLNRLGIRSMLFITSTCVDLLTQAINLVKRVLPDDQSVEISSILDMVSKVHGVEEMKSLTMHAMYGMACTMAQDSGNMSMLAKRARSILERRYMEPLTIPQIAKELHVSVNYLQNQFKKETGDTIRQYLTDVRIDRAKYLLRSGDGKIPDIADQVGYKDTDHFSRVFREATGITPNEYRKQKM